MLLKNGQEHVQVVEIHFQFDDKITRSKNHWIVNDIKNKKIRNKSDGIKKASELISDRKNQNMIKLI